MTLSESSLVTKIKVDSNVNIYCSCLRHYQNDCDEYISLRRYLSKEIFDEIVFYNLKTGAEDHSVKVFRDGPNAINGNLIKWETSSDYIPPMHIMEQNYYFVAGDNCIISSDSRYWGLVPEEFIVGRVDYITNFYF